MMKRKITPLIVCALVLMNAVPVSADSIMPSKNSISISEIQGKDHKSPLENAYVSNVVGVVTTVSNDRYQKGFYMQSQVPDSDIATSEGIFVSYKDTSKIKCGNIVSVTGTVKELINDSAKNSKGCTETSIKSTKVDILKDGSLNDIPASIDINMKGKLLTNIDDDNLTDFNPLDDAIDYYESLEGMLVNINDPLIVGADERYGEICVLPNKGEGSKENLTPNNGVKVTEKDFNPEIITIDDVIIPISDKNGFINKDVKIAVGDKFDNSIKGIMSYGFGKYKVLNTEKLPNISYGGTKVDITNIEMNSKKVTVASYNIENFNKSDQEKVDGIARNIIKNLKSPDIIGLIEVQDEDGQSDTGVTDASGNYKALIEAINRLGNIEYGYTDVAPENNKDGGAPGGNIRPGFIYRKDRVELSKKEKGSNLVDVQATADGLSTSTGRIGNSNPAFSNSRKSLAAEFVLKENNEKFVVIANHLNSKRGDQYLFGSIQPPVMESETKRHEQVKVINDFIKELKAKAPDLNVVALGDLNDFEFSDTVKILQGDEMIDMINKLPINERFTYVHNGNSQVLDHILVSKNLADKTKVDIVNINSQFTDGYGRLSDHDPVLVQIDLKKSENSTNTDNKPSTPDNKPSTPDNKPSVPDDKSSISNNKINELGNSNNNKLENKNLPKTGGVNSILYILLGVITLGTGTYLVLRKKTYVK